MLKRLPVLFALLSLGACCCGVPSEPEARPVHAVRLGTWYYLHIEDPPAAVLGQPLGPEHARVLRQITCDGVIHRGSGQIDDPCGFQNGDSDVLPTGTTLHPVGDIPGGQRVGAMVDGRLMIFAIHFPPD